MSNNVFSNYLIVIYDSQIMMIIMRLFASEIRALSDKQEHRPAYLSYRFLKLEQYYLN